MSADVDFDAAHKTAEWYDKPNAAPHGEIVNLARAYLALAAVSRPAEARGEKYGGLTFAPWTHEQVANLNAWQERGDRPPFTCGRDGCGEVLAAVPEGWVCPSETCDYTQNWAHNFMADRAAPRPETGEPSEAMRQAGAEAFAREDGIKEFSKLEPAQRAHYKALTGIILTAALAAREGA